MYQVDMIDINRLTLDKMNPRKISKNEMEKLKDSLRNDPDFLIVRPVLVNEKDGKYFVYAGNQRVRAAKELGWESILCHTSNDLSDKTIKERIIKDNQHYGDWDYDMLANEWDEDLLLDCGFDEKDLKPFFEDEAIDEEVEDKKAKKKKILYCPECAFEFEV